MTVWLRGGAALRLDAIAWFLWIRGDRSASPKPSKTEAIRVALVSPHELVSVQPTPHRCRKCGVVYGAPYCWQHGESHVTPHPTLVSEE